MSDKIRILSYCWILLLIKKDDSAENSRMDFQSNTVHKEDIAKQNGAKKYHKSMPNQNLSWYYEADQFNSYRFIQTGFVNWMNGFIYKISYSRIRLCYFSYELSFLKLKGNPGY